MNSSDFTYEVMRETKGGQHTNGPEHWPIKATHLPTGTVAICNLGRSQYENRRIAYEMLLLALTDPKVHY